MDTIVGKPGYTTTEFWVTALTVLASLAVSIFGKDWNIAANVQQLAPIAAAVSASAYAYARSHLKAKTHEALADKAAAEAYSAPAIIPTVGE